MDMTTEKQVGKATGERPAPTKTAGLTSKQPKQHYHRFHDDGQMPPVRTGECHVTTSAVEQADAASMLQVGPADRCELGGVGC